VFPAGDTWIAVVLAALADVALVSEPLVKYRQHRGNPAGAGRGGLRARLEAVRQNKAASFLERAELLRLADDRLADRPARPEFRRHIRRAEQHFRRRAALPAAYPPRVAAIGREVVTGSYSRYSDGWRSVAADLLLSSRRGR
jgi:hypothetical protein